MNIFETLFDKILTEGVQDTNALKLLQKSGIDNAEDIIKDLKQFLTPNHPYMKAMSRIKADKMLKSDAKKAVLTQKESWNYFEELFETVSQYKGFYGIDHAKTREDFDIYTIRFPDGRIETGHIPNFKPLKTLLAMQSPSENKQQKAYIHREIEKLLHANGWYSEKNTLRLLHKPKEYKQTDLGL